MLLRNPNLDNAQYLTDKIPIVADWSSLVRVIRAVLRCGQ